MSWTCPACGAAHSCWEANIYHPLRAPALPDARDEEIEQLRLRVADLENQLRDAQAALDGACL